MLQYVFMLFMWSVLSLVVENKCYNILDLNFVVYVCMGLVDCAAHCQKAYKTLKAEYGLLSGTNTWDTFLYVWCCMHGTKALFQWIAMGLLVGVSPISCSNAPILACVLLLYCIFIKEYANSIRKWWVSKYYHTVVTIPEDEI